MNIYKLGVRWGTHSPNFYSFIKERELALSHINECKPEKGSIVLIADGHTVLALAVLLEDMRPVTERPELEEPFEKYEIDFYKDVLAGNATWIELDPSDQFEYSLRPGIRQVQKAEIINRTKKLLKDYMDKKEMEKTLSLLRYKKQIILQGPPGTGKTRLAKELAEKIVSENAASSPKGSGDISEEIIRHFIKPNMVLDSATKYTSYTVQPLENSGVPVQLKTSGRIYKPSYQNIIEAYKTKLWQGGQKNGNDPYAAAIAKYIFEQQGSPTFEAQDEKVHLIQFHPSYTYEDFVRGITAKPNEEGSGILYEAEDKLLGDIAKRALANSHNTYVLIIDEINRANLSSVLGELIYALEYRGEEVDSMYAVGEKANKLTLPPNLYIIGTMNTADRSVGHIDYAIRRRFAFVEVLPQRLEEDDKIYFYTEAYEEVAKLFTTPGNVSSEFNSKDVQIGHSYFIAKKEEALTAEKKAEIFALKMRYEVLPILREYVRDGILVDNEAFQKVCAFLEPKNA